VRAFAAWLVFACVAFGATTAAYARYDDTPPLEASGPVVQQASGGSDNQATTVADDQCSGAIIGGSPSTYTGYGRTTTGAVGIPGCGWDYCARLLSAPVKSDTGMRASLYSNDGLWVSAMTGAGGPGNLGCAPIPAAARYVVKVYTWPEQDVTWEVTFQPRAPSSAPVLAKWRTDWIVPLEPKVNGDAYTFETLTDGFTPRFNPEGRPWKFCWEFFSVPPPKNIVSSNTYFNVTLGFEDEVGDFGRWSDRDRLAGDSGCVEMESRQQGRHNLLVRMGAASDSPCRA